MSPAAAISSPCSTAPRPPASRKPAAWQAAPPAPMAASSRTIATVASRLTATKAASGGPGSSATLRKAPGFLGCTGQTGPEKPISAQRRTTPSACQPPKTAIERGCRRRRRSTSGPEAAQDVAADDVALDLAGAVPDPLDPGVAPEALDPGLLHQPHAAEDLDRLVGDARQHLGREQLRLRDHPVRVPALVQQPGAVEREQVGGFDLGRHVGELERGPLELADRLAELLPARRPVGGEVEHPPRPADAGGGDGEPRGVEPGVHQLEALALLAQDLGVGDVAPVEVEDAVAVAAVGNALVARPDLETGRATVDEEAGDPLLGTGLRLLGPGRDEDDREVGEVGVADEVLGAVDHPVAAVATGRRLHRAHVGARLGLGHGEAVDLQAAHRGQEVAIPLLLVAAAQDVRGPAPEYG